METEKRRELYTLFCGLSTAFISISAAVSPIVMLIWLAAATERHQDTKLMDTMVVVLICCAVALVASLAMSIAAKIIGKPSKWATICIVLTAISIVLGVLAMLLFVFIASQYHYY